MAFGNTDLCGVGTFQALRKSEELPVKGYNKTITKSRSCLGKGWAKPAGLLTVSLPGVPAAARGEMGSCGMCITDLAPASEGKGLAQHRFARTVAIRMVLFVCFFSFLKQMSSAIASAR